MLSNLRRYAIWCFFLCLLVISFDGVVCGSETSPSQSLDFSVNPHTCVYTLSAGQRAAGPVLQAGIAAKVNSAWLHSFDYPKCTVAESGVTGDLGAAQQWVVEYSGLSGKPDLSYTLRSYNNKPFADIQASVTNQTGKSIQVEDIRTIETSKSLDLGGPPSLDRVLSDSFSEDRPAMRIRDLSDPVHQMHRAVGSQLIYNRQTHRSLFIGALTSDRFLTILRLHVAGTASDPTIHSYEADSTGTTEMEEDNSLRSSPAEDRVELSLPLASGQSMPAERLLIGLDQDPQSQLESYGQLIRTLHHPRPPRPTLIGWWSWTAYYFGLSEGPALTNAQWLAENLKSLGYDVFHIDEGYQYARGEYSTPDATLFPHGMAELERKVTSLGLIPGIWTAPFEVTPRSWVYQNHPDWLVHNAKGQPIHAGDVGEGVEAIYVLDVTNPGARAYLRQTYVTMSRDWGIRYFKLDFMDDSAIEGYHYKPNTTALEAQRIGLGIIREAVGDSVLLDKDGSVMLNPVGIVDEGRISQDTGHTFSSSKDAATGIAARFYMNRNYFSSDPDAFSVSRQTHEGHWHGGDRPISQDEAEVSIALSAVSGGMFEIGDDLPTLGSEPDRLALVKNLDLLDMARIGRASNPVDLMNYTKDDGQPSIFFLKEDPRQSILTVFNWTEEPRTHTFDLKQFGLRSHDLKVVNSFTGMPLPLSSQGTLIVEQPPHSVRVLKLQDTRQPLLQPRVTAEHIQDAKIGDNLTFTASVSNPEEPVLRYAWDFGDGVLETGETAKHTYTVRGTYTVRVKAEFLNQRSSEDSFTVTVTGAINPRFEPDQKRRFTTPQ